METPKLYRGEPYDPKVYRVIRQKDKLGKDKIYMDFLVSHEFIAANYARRLGEEKAYSAEVEEENKDLKNNINSLKEENRRLREGIKRDETVVRLQKKLDETKNHLYALQEQVRNYITVAGKAEG